MKIDIVQRGGKFFYCLNQLLKAKACLIRQRDLLLPRLMSGKLEV